MIRELFRSMGRTFSVVIGAMSVVALIARIFEVGLVSVLRGMMSMYDNAICVVFSRVEPYLRPAIEWLSDLLHLDLTLSDHWRHAFLLVAVYFFRDAEASIKIRRPFGAVFLTMIGLPLALAVGVGAGVVTASDEWRENFMIGEIAVVGITIYDVAKLLWYALFLRVYHAQITGNALSLGQFLGKYYRYPVGVFVAGTAVSAFMSWSPLVRTVADPGIATVLCLILLYTAWWLGVGLQRAMKNSSPGRPWWRLYTQSGPGLLGLAMATVFLWAVAVLALNFGAALLGFS